MWCSVWSFVYKSSFIFHLWLMRPFSDSSCLICGDLIKKGKINDAQYTQQHKSMRWPFVHTCIIYTANNIEPVVLCYKSWTIIEHLTANIMSLYNKQTILLISVCDSHLHLILINVETLFFNFCKSSRGPASTAAVEYASEWVNMMFLPWHWFASEIWPVSSMSCTWPWLPLTHHSLSAYVGLLVLLWRSTNRKLDVLRFHLTSGADGQLGSTIIEESDIIQGSWSLKLQG